MSEKTRIIQEIGDKELLLPRLINEALRANDRIKYYFTLLQTAKSRADRPDTQFTNMKVERQAAGVQDGSLDSVVEQALKVCEYYKVPRAAEVFERIKQDIRAMMEPLPGAEKYRDRFETLLHNGSAIENDMLQGEFLDKMTSVQHHEDSLHLIVMDMHRELNRLQASIYQDSIDGAKVYGIAEESDKLLVKAFMQGVNKTAKLKFDHLGLGTTATRSNDSVVIQNDIGATEAHVLVIRIKGMSALLTYTDVHIERLRFFQSLFEQFGAKWSDTTSKKSKDFEEGSYFLTVGTYEAKDHFDLENYLAFLGSRIVFLIDWNRARKRLRNFVKNSEAIKVLKWAADNNIGHMAFLKMGGDNLVIDAIETAPKVQLRYGQQLDDVLGRESAAEFLKFVLKASAEVMVDGKSEHFIRDEIRAELAKHFHGIHESLLEVARDHAELVVEISVAAIDASLQLATYDSESLTKVLRRTGRWEKRADDLLNKARQIIKRSRAPPMIERIIENADDAADSLEEAVFLLTLVPQNDQQPSLYEPLRELAEHANKAAMEYLKAVEGSRMVRTAGRDNMDDFLAAVDMAMIIEHQQDAVYRKVKAVLIREAPDFRQLHLFGEIAAKVEQGTDALMKAAILLRDYTLEEVVAR